MIQVVIGFMNAVQRLLQDEFKNNTKQIHKTYLPLLQCFNTLEKFHDSGYIMHMYYKVPIYT